jgi:cytochrome b561
MQHSTFVYTRTAITLHWMIFITVLGGWALGQYMVGLPFSPQKLRYVSWHKWIGVTTFIFTVLRLAWRVYRPAPPLPATMTALQRRAAALTHALLYVLVIVIPISGWLFSSASGVPTVYLGLIQLPDFLHKDKAVADTLRLVHASLNWTLLVLVCGHAAFALKHHFVDRDGVLARMIPILQSRIR